MSANPLYKAIYGARRRLGLDEDTYRARLELVTGKNSLRAMSNNELIAVRDSLNAKAGPTKALAGPYAKKLQALWLSGWNLGIVRDRRDSALLSFLERQTGIQRTEFLIDPEAAKKVVEALKGWLSREAGVDWSQLQYCEPYVNNPRYKIVAAQLRLLGKADARPNAIHRTQILIDILGTRDFTKVTGRQWIEAQKKLGEKIRGAK